MSRKIQPLSNPVVFNAIFNQPVFAADFLNATEMFNVKEENIIVESTKFPEGVNMKTADLDVVLQIIDQKTEYVNLEMQNRKPTYDMMGRLVYYLGKIICKSEPRKTGYRINRSTVLAIFNFTLFEDNQYIRTFKLKDDGNNMISNVSINVIELTKIQFCNKIQLKNWLDIFNETNLEVVNEGESEVMKKVKEEIRKLNDSPVFQIQLDLYEAHEEEREFELNEAKRMAIEEGMAQGIAQGMAQGMAQGVEKGMAEGAQKEKLEIAKKMKESKIDIEMIEKITDLDKETIKNL